MNIYFYTQHWRLANFEDALYRKKYLKLPNYTVYHTINPAGTARTAMIIISIKHHQINDYGQNFLQATSVPMADSTGPWTISPVYFSPRYTVKEERFEDFYNILGQRFIARGDYNVKHTDWGSRLVAPKRRELLKTLESNNSKYLSRGESMYWPTDMNKLPNLVDFCVNLR
jgi:hypothetical protein